MFSTNKPPNKPLKDTITSSLCFATKEVVQEPTLVLHPALDEAKCCACAKPQWQL